MTNDKTGAPTDVIAKADRFTILVDGQEVGATEFIDRAGQRIFPHTEIDEAFSGRGLATILVGEAIEATRDAGLRIVAVCSMVAGVLAKNPEFDGIVDPVTPEVDQVLAQR